MARDNLITAAASFLSSPQIKDHPDEKKRTFLYKKGLTNDEVIASFAKSRMSNPPKEADFNEVMDRCMQGIPRNNPTPGGKRPNAPFMVVATLSTVSAALVLYLYRFFRRYIWPRILQQWHRWVDRPKDPPPAEDLKYIIISQMQELESRVSKLKDVVDKQQIEIHDIIVKSEGGNTEGVSGIKQELHSVKRMLLSREQFPPPPVSSLPVWQIKKNDKEQPAPSNITITASGSGTNSTIDNIVNKIDIADVTNKSEDDTVDPTSTDAGTRYNISSNSGSDTTESSNTTDESTENEEKPANETSKLSDESFSFVSPSESEEGAAEPLVISQTEQMSCGHKSEIADLKEDDLYEDANNALLYSQCLKTDQECDI